MWWLATSQVGDSWYERRLLVWTTGRDPDVAAAVTSGILESRAVPLKRNEHFRVVPLDGYDPEPLEPQLTMAGQHTPESLALVPAIVRAMGKAEVPVVTIQRLEPEAKRVRNRRYYDGLRVDFRCHDLDRPNITLALQEEGLQVRWASSLWPVSDGRGSTVMAGTVNIAYPLPATVRKVCQGCYQTAAETDGWWIRENQVVRIPLCARCQRVLG